MSHHFVSQLAIFHPRLVFYTDFNYLRCAFFALASDPELRILNRIILSRTTPISVNMPAQETFNYPLESGSPAQRVSHLLSSLPREDHYYAYERAGVWHVGLRARSSLLVHSTGDSATISVGAYHKTSPVISCIEDTAREFLRTHAAATKVFGFVGFHYALKTRKLPFQPGRWPLLTLMVPLISITIYEESYNIVGDDADYVHTISAILKVNCSGVKFPHHFSPTTLPTDDDQAYIQAVEEGLTNIRKRELVKIILSRKVMLLGNVDMPRTLLNGRQHNNPRRSFCFSHGNFKATGFSPELVMSLEDGVVITEPLAGTRSCPADLEKREQLKNDLLTDPKEIVEHVLSVKAAVEELGQICSNDTVAVDDFMSVRVRGSVQHLGSRVRGQLRADKDAWDALKVLFPSITASGIPKKAALSLIESIEPQPRELYSGGVFMLDGPSFFDAALVLRTVFEDDEMAWLQAGAGVIDLSDPQRELVESEEKLGSIAPHVVFSKCAEADC